MNIFTQLPIETRNGVLLLGPVLQPNSSYSCDKDGLCKRPLYLIGTIYHLVLY